MNYTVSKKAKTVIKLLVAVGILFSILGLFSHMGEDNLFQRILVSGLSTSLYFFFIALGAFFFLALMYATETGWYAVIKRVIESVSSYIPYGIGFLVLIFLIITLTNGSHIYTWMDPETVAHDEIIQGKTPYLNKIFFWIRTIVYLGTYYIFWKAFRKRSLEEDKIGGTELHFMNYKRGAKFLVFFAVFSSTQSWDWIMSIDVHWFSTLFGWYTFAGMWCSAMTVLVLFALYLKKNGYLEKINESHIHDLGKWSFALSFLWSYMWFSQYMLIWYADIGEEVIYYQIRIEHFKLLYFGMFFINFFFPMLLLMSRDAKRHAGTLTVIGLIILVGHWLDVYQMVAIGSMGPRASIGFLEIGMLLLMLGIFIHVILNTLASAPIIPKNHPFLDESLHHEI